MSSYVITTDSTCDLPASYRKANQLPIIPLSYVIDGKSYQDMSDEMSAKDFYARLRAGSLSVTSQVNREDALDFFRPFLEEGKDILHIAFSSGLSGTCGNVTLAAEELVQNYPGRKILVADSLCASMGEGLLVHYALSMQKEGCPLSETADWIEKNKLKICHLFTVDDLNHLHRGGRVSKSAAFLGTMLGIKPILHVDDNGKLIPLSKIRGRRQALEDLVKRMEKKVIQSEHPVFFVSHADCLDDANYVVKLVRERLHIKESMVSDVGAVIGAHAGPGTIALFFLGDGRF